VDDLSRIVIIESNGQVLGMLVDCVAEVVYLKESEIDIAPNVGNDESSRFIQGVHSKDNTLLILVDINKLLTQDEWEAIQDV
jgi:purine-binding chemotaxis protein CheW